MSINFAQQRFAMYEQQSTPSFDLFGSSHSSGGSSKSSSSSTGKEKESDVDLLDKVVRDKLITSALPVDVELINGAITNLKQSIYDSPRTLSKKISDIYNMIGRAIYDKSSLTKAIEQSTKTGGFGDYAITPSGYMIVSNKDGKISQVTPEDFYKSKDKYVPLTNSELANIRANKLPLNQDITTIIHSSIGNQYVTDYINSTLQNYATQKDTYGIISDVKNKDVASGLDQLIAAALSGYNVTKAGSIEYSNVEAALNYLYKSMPVNIKNYIKVQLAANGEDPDGSTIVGKDADGKNIEYSNVAKYLHDAILVKSTRKEDVDSNISDTKSSSKSGDKDGATVSISNPNFPASQGFGKTDKPISIIPSSNDKAVEALQIPAMSSKIVKLDQKLFGSSASVGEVSKETGLFLDFSKAKFGDKPILGDEQREQVFIDNPTKIKYAMLPATEDGSVDTEFLKSMQIFGSAVNYAYTAAKKNKNFTGTLNDFIEKTLTSEEEAIKTLQSAYKFNKKSATPDQIQKHAKDIYKLLQVTKEQIENNLAPQGWAKFGIFNGVVTNDNDYWQEGNSIIGKVSKNNELYDKWREVAHEKGWTKPDVYTGLVIVPYDGDMTSTIAGGASVNVPKESVSLEALSKDIQNTSFTKDEIQK